MDVQELEPAGDPEIDPLTAQIDFLATRDGAAMAVEVIAAEVSWTVASSLQMATRVLGDRLQDEGVWSGEVRPLLIMVSDEVPPSIQRFADIEGLDVVHLPSPEVQEVLRSSDDPEQLAALSAKLIPAGGTRG